MKICVGLNENEVIQNLDDWKEKCPPKGKDDQWVIGRSAYELAYHWTKENGSDFLSFVNNQKDLKNLTIEIVSPEYETRFDEYGMGRVHDLVIIGKQNDKKVLITVEGKVDEGYGNDTIEHYYMKSVLQQMSGINTNVCKRIENIIKKLFSTPYNSGISTIQYQLITSVIGTLEEAQKQQVDNAIFIVHIFKTDKFDSKKYKINNNKFNEFLRILSQNQYTNIGENDLVGPIALESYNIPLYIGKVVTERDFS